MSDVTRPRSLRRSDLFGPLDMLASLWSAAALAPVRRLLVGRKLAVHLDGADVTFTVAGVSVGQLNNVRLAARDIRWSAGKLDRASLVLHNVRIRTTAAPGLVAAPVEMTLEVPAAAFDDLFRWAAPRLAGDIGPDGIARLRFARRPRLGHLEVDARLDGSTLWLRPRGLVVRRKRVALPRRTPAYPVQLPELPHGLQLTGVDLAPDLVSLTGTVAGWRVDLPRKRLAGLINQLSAVRPFGL